LEKSLDEDAEILDELALWTDKFLKENKQALKKLTNL